MAKNLVNLRDIHVVFKTFGMKNQFVGTFPKKGVSFAEQFLLFFDLQRSEVVFTRQRIHFQKLLRLTVARWYIFIPKLKIRVGIFWRIMEC
jgi:hypothetical protein